MKSIHYVILLLLFTIVGFGQHKDKDKIIIHHADFSDADENILPDVLILTGNISAEHDGMMMTCNKAYYFKDENYLKLFGDVHIVQQDTLVMNSQYAEYNGSNGFAYAQGNVLLTSPDSTMETDTLKYDRAKSLVFYDAHATITNKGNVLKSKAGRYYTQEKKFQFLTAVEITTNNGTIVKSNHLDYYEVPEHSYVFGPSTITNEDDFIYTENGFYDVQNDIAKLLKNSYIWYDQRKIEADSIYYNKPLDFASASYHVKITDTINKGVITSHYAEMFKNKDSVFVKHKPLVKIKSQEGDSIYMHAPIITLTGKENERIIRAYKDARILRDSMSGKADSIHSSQITGLTQMIGKPVLWSGENQLTGRLIHLLSNTHTEQLDSLKVLDDAFVIQQDTIGGGFNQLKGINLYGKFIENNLHELDLIKNAEMIYYMYNEKNELIGIDKGICSHINVGFEDNKIVTATRFVNPESDLYPDLELPKNARRLRDFIWRGDEKIETIDDLFSDDELKLEKKILEELGTKRNSFDEKMEILPETLEAETDSKTNLLLKKTK